MIAYVTLGTDDLKRAGAFYDALLAVFQARRVWEMDRSIGWGIDPQAPSFSVIRPYDGKPAQVGNGTTIALQAKSAAEVDEAHRKALELGGAMREHPDPAVRTTRPTSATSTGTAVRVLRRVSVLRVAARALRQHEQAHDEEGRDDDAGERTAKSAIVVPKVVEATIVAQYSGA